MTKIFASIAAAAFIAAGFVALPAMSASQVEAAAPAPVQTKAVAPMADRFEAARIVGAECSQRAWPHYEAGCLLNAAAPSKAVVTVRNVSTDKF